MSTTYELEDESVEMKMSLMIFHFFEDLYRIQGFLHGIWKSYKNGNLDLVSASLINNSAFEVVHRDDDEILATAPNLFSKKQSYDTITIVIFYTNAFSQGHDQEQTMATNKVLRPTPFADFIYLSTSRTLMEYDFLSKQGNLRGVQFPENTMLTNISMSTMQVPESAIRPDGTTEPVWLEKLVVHARAESAIEDEQCDPQH
ncbi:bacde91c-fdf8-4e31-be09-60a505117f4e [Sclerotinia trifoliorum]|uniref:Bacde91c-fdf8-4e31-be09-60a505117f4e n=1 Tax=Sclerotinia trifoliorum TaxID=28548 RepID=A0A8H2W104_9HELO|nr:bacde91c-fdf8-4e31-be09-60a505117f4e [Sclerotinia trifoliorum]